MCGCGWGWGVGCCGVAEFAGGSAGVFFEPAGEVGGVAEAAFSGDVGDSVVGAGEEHLGFLESGLGDGVDEGDAGVAVEEAGEGAAVVVELLGQRTGGQVGVGEAFTDEVADLLDDGVGLGDGEMGGDVVETFDGEERGLAVAVGGLVVEGFDHGVDAGEGRGPVGEDAGAEAGGVDEGFGLGAVDGEPAHFGAGLGAPEGVGVGGEVDGDLAGEDGEAAAFEAHEGLAGDDPLDENEAFGPWRAKAAFGHVSADGGAKHDGEGFGLGLVIAFGATAVHSLDPRRDHGGIVTFCAE